MRRRQIHIKKNLALLAVFLLLLPQIPLLNVNVTLPPPEISDMILEQAISRRASVRAWKTENITSPELSEILWAANGYSQKNPAQRTTASIDGSHSILVFVVNSTAAYRYVATNHSLVLWKYVTIIDMVNTMCWPPNNNYNIGAAAILFFVWNKTDSSNIYFNYFNLGCIIQNVYLTANSIGLGTVSQSEINQVNIQQSLDLSPNYEPLISMPLGYPENDYPNAGPHTDIMSNNLPKVKFTNVTLDTAIDEVLPVNSWSSESLSNQELSQLLWAAYGYLNISRQNTFHRTVPSAYAAYPMKIYVLNQSGVYLYIPETHSLSKTLSEDKRYAAANAAGGSIWAAAAPVILVTVYNSMWVPANYAYLEAGLIAQELSLEARALGLGTVAIGNNLEEYNGEGALALRTLLDLPEGEIPLYIQPVGHLPTIEIKDVIVRSIVDREQLKRSDPWTEYYANVSIISSEPFHSLLNITWIFSSTGAFENDDDDFKTHYTFRWTPNEGFTEQTLSQHIIKEDCRNVSLSLSTGWFRLAFRLGKSANRTLWRCKVIAFGTYDSASQTSPSWMMNTYIGFNISSSLLWDPIIPGSINISASSMPLNITVSSNVNVDILIKGNGDLTDGSIIPLSNVYVGQTNIPQNNDGVKLTTSYQIWKKGIPFNEEGSHSSYWFLTVPAEAQSGNYTFSFYIEVTPES